MNVTVCPASSPLRGTITVPGDKSISHRALLLGALAEGTTTVHNFLRSADCLSTASCLKALGVGIEGLEGSGPVTVAGRGLQGLAEPEDVLDAGNSGTTARLLLGILAGQPFTALLTGDASLRRRPMARVTAPLARMGAQILGRRDGSLLPLAVRGGRLRGGHFALPVASAQLKSALLLAGLNAEGETSITEPAPSRDHTERMLAAWGVPLRRAGSSVILPAGPRLRAQTVSVPGDISAAAFFLVAAAILPGSQVTIKGVGVNSTRTGVLDVLARMGAPVTLTNRHEESGEPLADITVAAAPLQGVEIAGQLIPRLIDEIPALAVAACYAQGETVIRDAAELRVKESDRLAALARELGALGADIRELPDGLIIRGRLLHGGEVKSHGDHRLAMALAVAALAARGPVTIAGADCVSISFPTFFSQVPATRRH
ncbi:MAG: 3-phosphoshikimate 1-carboxyvinyltransferase [Bacillota bacterium]|nr:3-phosphoshikimate 1-carboxyvinyltransferase [Bacillota bacterium]MDK2926537.1 3-phosphoshikimate 1-carboxyvinyltransferase [Bacillota bacterium]